MPVKANATQEILYGPTLAPFILGELIGGALVDKAGIKPDLILTDCEQFLELRSHIASPVALVTPDAAPSVGRGSRPAPPDPAQPLASPVPPDPAEADATSPSGESTATQSPPPEPLPAISPAEIASQRASAAAAPRTAAPAADGSLRLGKQTIRFHAAHTDDAGIFGREGHQIPADANLCEPFDRVREALQETMRCGALR